MSPPRFVGLCGLAPGRCSFRSLWIAMVRAPADVSAANASIPMPNGVAPLRNQ